MTVRQTAAASATARKAVKILWDAGGGFMGARHLAVRPG